jgi:hypothetical protein
MRTARIRRIGRREADELLSASPVNPDRAALRHLLDQITGTPRPEELAGRQAAVAAFVRAVRDPVPAPGRVGRRSLALLSRAAVVKVVIGLAVLLCGSAALAAGTGNLPDGVQHGAHELFAPLGVPVPDGNDRHTGGSVGGGGTPSTNPAAPTGSGSPLTDPAALGLCRAWAVAGKDDHGKGLDPAATQALARAAGGTDKIAGFCGKLLGGAPGSAPPAPGPAASPPAHPGPPTDKPSHSPNGKGKPRPSPSPGQ